MQYNQLGDSSVKVSAIAFGAWAIGGWMWGIRTSGGSDDEQARRALDACLDLGITSIDTAPIYGFGHSETLVGKALAGKRHQAQILTKFGMRWQGKEGEFFFPSTFNDGKPVDIYRYAGRASVIQECEDSLRRLGTDYIDLYQIHWDDPTTPIEETMEAVAQLLQQGKIRAAGVCNYTADQMRTAEKVVNIASNQVPYSMVKRDIEQDVVPYCLQSGQGILAYSPLQRGLLTGKITDEYRFNEGDTRPDAPEFKPARRRAINAVLDQMRPLAEAHGVTLGQLVINWTLRQPAIACALVGARDDRQVAENAKALDFTLATDELARLNGLLADLPAKLQSATA